MKKLLMLLVMTMLASTALAKPPSDSSLKELLRLMDAPKIMDVMKSSIEQGMRVGIAQELAKHPALNPAQEKIADDMPGQFRAILDRDLSWEKMEPLYLQVYRETFTQDEINSFIRFYKTPAGRAAIEKMPTAAHRAVELMTQNMKDSMQQLQAMAADDMQQMKDAQ